ncbi:MULTISPECIES: kelch motif-containing protein [Streptomyces]|uniref:Kelch motif-containing protein n=2 Tax=Streptomyces violaceoruber group TaxID=2867121 RepID=A0ABT4P773_9ACTN|nr:MULTISPECIES: kelch motif-containing protein [Streptomyces]MCW8118285.1 kelch motif-containing protein [Streptomyces anthocyanicus]MCZ4636968.1 kelch motif-containing protein [Streptomyces rubrogriseus]MDX3317253.1 kelch motif-containing protein [Streptomyces sp. ME03-5684b]MDX3368407.1 kelch motif-containing protein [Streptomyces sp. ME02-6987-2C]MDX3424705.1 kelch motif-containing protein [Streptomyces sp. ME02-6985-2c]
MKDRAGRRRARRFAIGTAVVVALAGMNGPWLYRFSTEKYHQYKINQPEYKAANGKWEIIEFPEKYRQNTIHAALLRTGKVLMVAGSGNNQDNSDDKQYDTRIWDPVKGTIKKVPTPSDLFCTGHTQLANGNLLIAGGTKRYEKLKGDVTKAGGLMVVHNENPDKPITLPAGTKFTGKENGKTFVSKDPVLVPRAEKVFDPATGAFVRNDPGLGRIYVEAQKSGSAYETGTEDNYRIQGLSGADARNTYGIAQKLALDKKDFQGIRDAFEFDPVAEKYIKVDPMHEARWYPTLTTLGDGKILSVSGLDDIGQLVPGKNEVYDPKTKAWTYTDKVRQFPTYPALFLMQNGKIFYSGANAGYGPDDVGRTPGIWDVETNKFTKVPGMSDADMLETANTVLLPPAQDEKYMVIGGGGVGESKLSSEKTRIADLKADDPKFVDGPSLEKGTRYPQASILPDDSVLVSGGSEDYRGRGDSNILQARLYHPDTNEFEQVADPLVGRNYHSGSILLPDGRLMFFGSDSLYADKANTKPGKFEQRIEIYTPPYLYRDSRPDLSGGPQTIARGGSGTFTSRAASTVKKVRLIRPSASTHVTDVDQRSIALDFTADGDKLTVTVPTGKNLVQSGWYMMFVTDGEGTPSKAEWVRVP